MRHKAKDKSVRTPYDNLERRMGTGLPIGKSAFQWETTGETVT